LHSSVDFLPLLAAKGRQLLLWLLLTLGAKSAAPVPVIHIAEIRTRPYRWKGGFDYRYTVSIGEMPNPNGVWSTSKKFGKTSKNESNTF
jgi:hypothetical protein